MVKFKPNDADYDSVLERLQGVAQRALRIVLAFVYWLHDSHPNVPVFWVHASSADNFRKDYAAIATQYKIPGHDDPKTNILSLVKTWLETRLQAQWLMVIDNADDLELFYQHQPMEVSTGTTSQQSNEEIKLAGYIPKCDHGLILITTRDRKLAVDLVPQQSPVEIHHMTQEEAHLFMCKILDKRQRIS
ncbi:tpr domain containing protein [Grosmannia clavigera kw1407]|uniref:Tpr domain containing protein n=1 Tax=Grosmannia clavigera (strain kw1407 / UAMH 11150) TaxID=655863 RepID=F0XEU1_GROCL|nr:tpr domain containing protein [Grosmannia clavigera kw1407]EFX04199.1 tpr domain containing protein [Grosmannia clavigera kw1407]